MNPKDLFNTYNDDGSLKHTEESITKILRNHYNQGYTYRIANAFIYASDWECDYFCLDMDGYAYEFEVKISRADFQNDFQKYKHLLFKRIDKKGVLLPNRFYYVVPENLISAAEIPKYAGLIYIVGTHVKVVKRAPFIHKEKRDYRRILCDKFYLLYVNNRKKTAKSQYSLKIAKTYLEQLRTRLSEYEVTQLKQLGLLD